MPTCRCLLSSPFSHLFPFFLFVPFALMLSSLSPSSLSFLSPFREYQAQDRYRLRPHEGMRPGPSFPEPPVSPCGRDMKGNKREKKLHVSFPEVAQPLPQAQ